MLDRPANLVSQVLSELESRIYCGCIQPGAKVRESALAEELGVSRGPVREACRSLEVERILVSHPQRGSFVRLLTAEEAGQLFDIRDELSGMIARSIAEAEAERAPAREPLADRLAPLAAAMADGIAGQDLEGFFPLNLAFHRTLLEGTGNKRLEEIFMGLFKELRLFRIQAFLADRARPERVLAYNAASNEGHEGIVAAVASGSADRLETALREQVASSRSRSAQAFAEAEREAAEPARRRA